VSIRQWGGQRSDVPIVSGEHLLTAQNVSFHTAGQISRRAGLTYIAAEGGKTVASFGNAITGNFLVFVQSDGNVEAVAL
jgi:hypothetical protein